MAFNLFKKSKKPEADKSPEQPSELTPESSDTASSPEDSKLLESQLEALGNVNDEMKDEEKEEEKMSREREKSKEATGPPILDIPSSEPQNAADKAGKEEAAPEAPKAMIKKAIPETSEEKTGEPEREREAKEPAQEGAGGEPGAASPFDEGPIEISQKEAPPGIPVVPGGEIAEEKKPAGGETSALEEVTPPESKKEEKEVKPLDESTPPSSEDIQQEADKVSTSFEEGGGKSSFVRLGAIVVLIVLIVGSGAFAYLQFFGGSSQLPFLKNIPYLGTYFGGSEPAPSVPFPAAPATPEPTPSPTPVPEAAREPVPSPQGAGDSERIADIDNLRAQLLIYYIANASYPSTDGEIEKILSDTVQDSMLYTALVPVYLPVLPVDPNPSFYYGYSSDGTSYELTSVLEDKDNPECVLVGDFCVRRIVDGEVVSNK